MPKMRGEPYHVHHIEWDTDGVKDLPTEVVLWARPTDMDGDTFAADTLTSTYGWCIKSLKCDPIPDAFSDAQLRKYQKLIYVNGVSKQRTPSV